MNSSWWQQAGERPPCTVSGSVQCNLVISFQSRTTSSLDAAATRLEFWLTQKEQQHVRTYVQRRLFSVQTSDPVILFHSGAHKREVHNLILETLGQCRVHSECSGNIYCYCWKTRDKTKSKKQRTTKKEKTNLRRSPPMKRYQLIFVEYF